jgi:hypothetical protein
MRHHVRALLFAALLWSQGCAQKAPAPQLRERVADRVASDKLVDQLGGKLIGSNLPIERRLAFLIAAGDPSLWLYRVNVILKTVRELSNDAQFVDTVLRAASKRVADEEYRRALEQNELMDNGLVTPDSAL